ncbi:MAG: TonB-dependent receptor [Prolixibacteraceae bacterium]|nr:TonB-dependent receptor [Prolixibacteraceae bacterium]
MRTTLFVLFITISQVFALGGYSQNTRLSLNLKDAAIKDILQEIENKSDFYFMYDARKVNVTQRVDIASNNMLITEILDRVFRETEIKYRINNRLIALSNEAAPVSENIKKVTGKVTDASGAPLPGVSVVVKGTTSGTITNADGEYSLANVPANVTLQFSFVGMKMQEVKVAGKTSVNVALEDETIGVEEVVVVGYGTQKKQNLTGAIASVSGDVLNERPIGNIAQGLQGMIPNLNITFRSGQPNAGAGINIRGNTSLNGGSALVLIDGVEGDLSLLNPQDVESVSVLKDASSAAIYGARAAFGVMLVTTKQGRENQKTKINYNNNLAWSTPARLPEMPRADVWARAWNDAYDSESPGDYYFSDRFLAALDAHIADPENNPAILVDTEGIQSPNYTPNNPGWAYVGNTDWINEFYKSAAFMQQHNLNISGGSEKSSYYLSAGIKDQGGIFRYGNDTYKRYNLAFTFDTKITDWFDLGFSAKYNYTNSNEPYKVGSSEESWYYEVYRMFPTLSVFLPNGDFAGMSLSRGNLNVIGRMANAGRSTVDGNDMWYTGRFDLHPLKGLSIKGNYTLNKYFSRSKVHRKTIYQTMPEGVNPIESETPNFVSNGNAENEYQTLNFWAEYNWNINKMHNFKLMGGYNQEGKDYRGLSFRMSDLFDNETPISDLAINYVSNSETDTRWRVQGLFYRINYDLNSKYLLELNGRYDGSSKFPSDKRHVFVPSASAGWRISEENFFAPLKNVVDNLKLRASVGVLGNQAISSYFSYIASLNGGAMTNYMMNGEPLTYLSAPSLPNNVTWEKVINKDFGLDLTLLQNRLTGTFDYYIRDTKDMIRSVTLPAVLGTSGGQENLADMRTNGWEMEISWRDKINNICGSPLTYSLSAGLSDYQSEITKFDNPTGSLSLYYKGMKMGEYWGYVTDGYIKDEKEASRMNYIQNFIYHTWKPGDIRYRDVNNDGVIDIGKNTLDNPGDRVVIGNNTPRYRYNFQGSIGWKGFDLWVMFDGVGKRDVWTSSDQFWGFTRGIYNGNIFQYHIDNTWSPENPDAYFPRKALNNRNIQRQSKYLLDASYIRLKGLTFGYTFPKQITSRLSIDQLKLYFSGNNLWEKTHMPPFMTPDITESLSDGGSNSGKEYAFMRSFSFGLNISF